MSESRLQRHDYRHFHAVSTRWQDNDIYGHINNVAYYSFFDTAINAWLIERGGLDIHDGKVAALVVSSACDYFASVAYPQPVEVGLRVARFGGSSVQYEVAVFTPGEDEPCAAGRFVQVFIERESGQPVAIPEAVRDALQILAAP